MILLEAYQAHGQALGRGPLLAKLLGLKKEMTKYSFLTAMGFFHRVLLVIGHLATIMQSSTATIADVLDNRAAVCDQLQMIENEESTGVEADLPFDATHTTDDTIIIKPK